MIIYIVCISKWSSFKASLIKKIDHYQSIMSLNEADLIYKCDSMSRFLENESCLLDSIIDYNFYKKINKK